MRENDFFFVHMGRGTYRTMTAPRIVALLVVFVLSGELIKRYVSFLLVNESFAS